MAYTDIDKPSDYFNTVLYTGNGTTQSVTGVNFQPDWVWLKQRANDVSNRNHMLFDSVRGTQKALSSNTTGTEDTSTAYLTSYDSDGFTLGGSSVLNRNTTTYASWNWLASNTTASNTDGSITSTVSANTTSGFSIGTYTGNGSAGATIGHGLGTTPKCFIVKRRNTAAQWNVYHESLGNTGAMYLNDSGTFNTVTGFWNNTSPNSNTFTLGTDAAGNGSSDTYVFYAFAEKKGFSKFGSYTGNGSGADAPFIYTGFKPAFLITKRTDTSGYNWYIWDNKRNIYNPINKVFYADTSDVETDFSAYPHDLTSNGFKIRTSNNAFNSSGGTYIYMAFAENPFVTSTGIPTTAR